MRHPLCDIKEKHTAHVVFTRNGPSWCNGSDKGWLDSVFPDNVDFFEPTHLSKDD